MSVEQRPTEVAMDATEAAVIRVACHALRARDAEVTAARLAGDASSRAFYRVTHPGGTLVAVWYPAPFDTAESSGERLDRWCAQRPDGRLTFANDPLCHVELTSVLLDLGIPVPGVVAVSGEEGIVLVADAGDALLQTWASTAAAGEVEAAYERAVDLIAAFQAATGPAVERCAVAGRLAFDADKLGWELEFFRSNCFERYLGAPLDPADDAAVRDECREIASELAARPRVLCHRDYHARNILVLPGLPPRDALVVIDYQDARLGPVTYDVVSLVEDPYADLPPSLAARLRDRFVEGLRGGPLWPGDEAFRTEYDLMTVQRLLKAVGTYTHQAAVRGRQDYVPYIAPAVAVAGDALDRIGRFPALRGAIDRIGKQQ